jgi:hypothetical protein
MPSQILNKETIDPTGQKLYTSGTPEGVAITAQSLAPQTPFTPVQPTTTPVASVAGLNAELAPLPQESQQSDLITQLQGLTTQTVGEAGFQAEQEKVQGIPELQKTQSDLSARLKTLQNEALAIPLQLQQEAIGRGITAGGLQPIQTAALRNNAIQALSVSSLLEASRGNLTTAQSLADRATAQKYDPIKAEINAKLSNLEILSKDPTLTLAQKNRADAQKAIQEQRQAEIAKQESDSKEINSTLNLAIKYGLTNTGLMEKIQNASTPIEAKQLASRYLQDPMAQYELNAAKADILLKQAQLAKVQKETRLLGEKTDKEIKEEKAALKNAQTAIPILQDKIDLIDVLKDSRGLAGSVGAYGIARFTPFAIDKADRTRFIAGVQQLVNKETIDTLVNLKERGGTLGALSDQERILLQSAATKIGSWQLVDDTGKVYGYEVDEKSFKDELESIKKLAQRALVKASGNVFDDAETSLLDELYQSQGVLSPASFY